MSKDEELNWLVRGHLANELGDTKRFIYGQDRVGGRLESREATISVVLNEDGVLRMYLSKLGNPRARLVLMGKLLVVGEQVILQEINGLGFQVDTALRVKLQGVIDVNGS